MKLPAFFLRYLRRYAVWAVVSVLAILVYAASMAALMALVEPIFGEVLLAGRQDMPAIAKLSGMGSGAPEAGGKPAAELSTFQRLKRKFDLAAKLDRGYASLKKRLGVGPENVVYFLPLLMVVVVIVRSCADFLSGYSFQRIGLGTTTDIRNDLYWHVLNQSSRFHAEHASGELMARVINDVTVMQSAVSTRLLDLFQQSVTLVFLLVLLLTTNFQLAVICLVATPVLVYPIVRFGKGMRRTSHRSQERMADLASLMNEGVRGHRVVKAFNMEEFEYGRFRTATSRHLRVNLRAQVLAHISSPVVESLAVVGGAALLVYAGLAIRASELTAPRLVKFLVTLLAMYDPVRKLNKVNLILQEALAAAQRVSRLLSTPNDIVERAGAKALDSVRREIRFEDVRFAYEERPVLDGVNLTIHCGEIVALVGPSGAGKSTLVNLLPRFFDPVSGRVSIDGVDIRDLTLRGLRTLIGIVTQDTVLFDDTVRNNIAYGRKDLPVERVREAAAAAYADEFIMELPEGYDTMIGEGGLRLSGGQRQRLAIARALLKNAPILILDEATSQLDSQSEALVQKALYNLMQGRTTLVIAHRLSTVTKADRILVMEGGRVVEQGSHQELLARKGTYKRLYDLQFRA